jgi:hypothetical protein
MNPEIGKWYEVIARGEKVRGLLVDVSILRKGDGWSRVRYHTQLEDGSVLLFTSLRRFLRPLPAPRKWPPGDR